MKVVIKIALLLWQLPQVLVGLMLYLFYRGSAKLIRETDYTKVYACSMPGGISLGVIVLINKYQCTIDTINHELGHTKQSRILGPLYLLVIGLPSIIHAGLSDYIGCCKKHKEGYYHFYTEKWADKIAGITRD